MKNKMIVISVDNHVISSKKQANEIIIKIKTKTIL